MKNAIKQRLPKSAENLQKLENKFVDGVEKTSLQDLTLDELAHRYADIDQQSQMLKGQILLEARERFPSDKEFGQWIVTVGLSDSSRYTRSTYMNLARFFKDRDITGISITAAYEISAPINADIAEEIYEYTRGKNMAVADVKTLIAKKKGESLPPPVVEKITQTDDEIVEKAVEMMEESVKTETVKIGLETDLKTKLYAEIGDTPPFDAIRVLQEMINEIRDKVYRK